MKLPMREKAYVPPRKLVDYLLSASHPVGRSKAKFFRSAGFDETNAHALEQRLIGIALSEEVTELEHTSHGIKYTVEGVIQTPAEGAQRIRTVWIIETGQERPRFVTAYPV